ncbi:armadillo repeat-containing protein 2 isoform X2 [Toxorhynchites rutilus septentrionalis]|nr:armadillo repeat-containing protein 2 isoform X2 [Toxorhynchites rutilus septentrionalis]XP_055621595.1 armadillo repeat-containing protein 2 isoform X2 [Toxorhynchites rutilus septentrionalis]
MLAGGGTRLVSARRPITPRDPRRQLYGRVAPPGRPPSAISLKYLQFESRNLPSLEPIQSAVEGNGFKRSESTDSISYPEHDATNNNQSKSKLPALHKGPNEQTGSLGNLSECMSMQKDFKSTGPPLSLKVEPKLLTEKRTANGKAHAEAGSSDTMKSIVKNHPLKRRQFQSLDEGSMAVAEKTSPSEQVGSVKADQLSLKAKLSKSNDLLVQSTNESLLEMLKAHAGIKECSDETVGHINGILGELYMRVKGSKGSWRGAVLGALYGLVEANSAKILLSVARVVLALNVTGSNLAGACKLVFKIARNENNDTLFADSDVPELLVDGLGRASPADEPEACIYGYGAIRFLASSAASVSQKGKSENSPREYSTRHKSLAYRLTTHGLIQLMILHLKMLNELGSAKKLSGPPLHALFQLSGALRTLAGIPSIGNNNPLKPKSQSNSVNSETDEKQEGEIVQLELAGPLLVRAAEMCIEEPEVQANVIRTLSVLSERPECCEQLADASTRLGILLGSITETSPTIERGLAAANRLGYILGNIMARWDAARLQFYSNDVSITAIINALEFYCHKRLSIKNQMGDSVVEVLTKLVRVVANICVNSDVGYGLSNRPSLGETLLKILLKVKDSKEKEMDELLFATLGALHNLCYYYEPPENPLEYSHPGSVAERLKDICGVLCSILSTNSNPARSEVARVLGNMTRNASARQTFCSENGLKIIISCLESNDVELMVTSCGVLVNILGDWQRRAPFREIQGPIILRKLLQRGTSNQDWILAGIACQALWNYLIDSGNVINSLGESELDYICGDLAECLDEEKLFNGQEPDRLWEEFAPVATDLMERLQSCLSLGDSPCLSSDEDEADMVIGQPGDLWGDRYKQWLQQ